MQKAVVIVAGGVGSRMKVSVPKQFIEINGKPLIIYTIAAFVEHETLNFDEIIIVCHKDYLKQLEKILATYFKDINFVLIEGGQNRFHSCYNGLKAIDENNEKLVAIHDAARPLVSKQLITTVFEAAATHQSAIPVVKLKDSVRMLLDEENNSKIVDRNQLRLVQTPQCFHLSKLLQAYEKALNKSNISFTDDASVWETSIGNVHLCEGDLKNIKVTTPIDLALLQQTICG